MRFKRLSRPLVGAGVPIFLLLSALVLLASTGGLGSGASAQSAAESPSAQSKKPKIKQLTTFPKKLNFGSLQPFQASPARTITIHNPNSIDIAITSIESSDPQFAPSGSCMGSVAANSDCQVSVVFTPSSDGKKSGKLTVVSGASSKALSIGMTGQGKGTASPTPTRTPTPTPTPAACPSPSPGACNSPGAPTVSSLIPSSAVAGGPDVPLAVCGCNLTASATIQWNQVDQITSFVSPNQVNASIRAADIAHIGVDQVTVSSGSQASTPQTFFVGSTGGSGFAELEINQPSNDIVSDPVNQVIYLSVPGSVIPNGNTVSVLDLASGQISSSQFAGSEPNVLAISDDSQFLYAGIDGASSVQRFTLPALTPDINYSLGGNQFFGAYFALDLQVAPGAPHTVAVSLGNMGVDPSAIGGIAVFDDSVPRPTVAGGFGPGGGGGVLYDSIQWGSDDTDLYAANGEDTGFDFYALSVNPSGVTLAHDYPSAFSSFFSRIHFDAGTQLIYADDGHTINPSTGSPAGVFTTSSNAMVPDSSLNRAFFISQSGATTIQAFDLKRFNLIGSITIPNVSGSPLRIVRWGNNGLAFNTQGGPVYLIGGNFVH